MCRPEEAFRSAPGFTQGGKVKSPVQGGTGGTLQASQFQSVPTVRLGLGCGMRQAGGRHRFYFIKMSFWLPTKLAPSRRTR